MRAAVPFGYNLQRILDDFVFLCFFVGNDFLPHIPTLTIREGGIDILMKVYEYCLGIMPDYITCQGELNFESLRLFVNEMKMYERDLVEQLISKEGQAKQRDLLQKQRQEQQPKVNTNEKDNFIDWSDPLSAFKQQIRKFANVENNLENYSVFSHQIFNYKEKYYREKFRIEPA